MARYGLLIDYEFCTGCHSCEIACKQEHQRPEGQWGIRVMEVPSELSGNKLYYFPFPTDNCNLCGKRIAIGLEPSCVKHCQAGVMRFGKVEELAEHMKRKPRMVLWTPR